MAKFIIECPHCGAFQEVSNGLFSKKIITCKCGKTIDVKKDKISFRECPHCRNQVLYDQSKGVNALCPICKNKLNSNNSIFNTKLINCPTCLCELRVDNDAKHYKCPLCNENINVQEAIVKKGIQQQGKASLIQFNGSKNELIWKHPIEDFNFGSQLIVDESQEAIFYRDGQALDCFGPGRYTLTTQKLPLLEDLYKIPFGPNQFFKSKIYFVNLTVQTGIKWGTDSKVRLFDPTSGLTLELGAYGEFSLRIINSRKLLIKLLGTGNNYKTNDMIDNPFDIRVVSGTFKALIVSKVKAILAKHIKKNNINILEIDAHLDELAKTMKEEINTTIENYGIEIQDFYVLKVLTPDDDPNFKKMKEQYAEQYLLVKDQEIKKKVALEEQQRRIVEAQTGAQEEIIAAQAQAEAHRLRAEAEALEMKMKGYTYQDETRRQIGVKAMENLPDGGGNIGGMMGDMVNLGVTMGALGQIVDITKNAISPAMQGISNDISNQINDSWNCSCGQTNIQTPFCPNCGSKKPQPSGWNCSCGQTNIQTPFCPNCGSKKPQPSGWNCSCGQTNIQSPFCPNCGSKKIEPTVWDCSCGQTNIQTLFCPNCGNKRG